MILDCDGVLIDSEVISAGVLADALAALGLPVDRDYVLQHFLGRTFPSMAAEVKRQFGVELTAEFARDHEHRLHAAFASDLTVMPGVRRVLDQLAVPFCLATSSSPARVTHSLATVGLTDVFDGRVFSAAAVAHGKPAPDLFLHVARQMAVAPDDCLVVEDSVPGLQAAHNAGMTVWHFTGGSHTVASPPHLPGGVNPDRTFDSFGDFFEAAPQLRNPAAAET